ncbi:MAG: hypothetical protein OHK0019_00610 [Saprospiraceae bacterium]
MTKKEVAQEIREVLRLSQLSARAGKYEFFQTAGWYFREGRERLKKLADNLEKSAKAG